MEVLLWIAAVALVVVGIAGIVLPALPGTVLIFAGLLLGALADGFTRVGWPTLLVIGLLGVADQLREGAAAAVGQLRASGVRRICMLTGDNEQIARIVAQQTGVDEYYAGALPEDKVQRIEELRKLHGAAAMVGDGVNDSPAMAAATVGIAMGAIGSDAAIETADIALMSDDLSRLPWLIGHARRTVSIIRQNIALALGLKVLFVVLAICGFASLWMAIAADMGASLLVIGSALRLLK